MNGSTQTSDQTATQLTGNQNGKAIELNQFSEIQPVFKIEKGNGYDTENTKAYNADSKKETLLETVQRTVSEKEKNPETRTSAKLSTENSEKQSSESNKKIIEQTASGQIAVNGNVNGNVFCGSISLSRSGIINLGRPTPYRGDCQMGKFKIKANPVSDTLDFTVLAIRHLQGEFFNYEYQDWIEIIFADEKKIVSAMLLKTESMDNFGLTTKFILSSGKRLIDVVITGYFVKKNQHCKQEQLLCTRVQV